MQPLRCGDEHPRSGLLLELSREATDHSIQERPPHPLDRAVCCGALPTRSCSCNLLVGTPITPAPYSHMPSLGSAYRHICVSCLVTSYPRWGGNVLELDAADADLMGMRKWGRCKYVQRGWRHGWIPLSSQLGARIHAPRRFEPSHRWHPARFMSVRSSDYSHSGSPQRGP